MTPITPHAALTSIRLQPPQAPRRGGAQAVTALERGAQTLLLHILTFLGEAELQFPCSRAGESPHGQSSRSLCPDRGVPTPDLFSFHPEESQDHFKTRSQCFVLRFKKEELLIYIMTILYFLFTSHPFQSLTPPKILFAFLIGPIHQEKALREQVVTVPRSFSWAESINLHPRE